MLHWLVLRIARWLLSCRRRLFGAKLPHWLADLGLISKLLNPLGPVPVLSCLLSRPHHLLRRLLQILPGKASLLKDIYRTPVACVITIGAGIVAVEALFNSDFFTGWKSATPEEGAVFLVVAGLALPFSAIAFVATFDLFRSLGQILPVFRISSPNPIHRLVWSPSVYRNLNWGVFAAGLLYLYLLLALVAKPLVVLIAVGGAVLAEITAYVLSLPWFLKNLNLILFLLLSMHFRSTAVPLAIAVCVFLTGLDVHLPAIAAIGLHVIVKTYAVFVVMILVERLFVERYVALLIYSQRSLIPRVRSALLASVHSLLLQVRHGENTVRWQSLWLGTGQDRAAQFNVVHRRILPVWRPVHTFLIHFAILSRAPVKSWMKDVYSELDWECLREALASRSSRSPNSPFAFATRMVQQFAPVSMVQSGTDDPAENATAEEFPTTHAQHREPDQSASRSEGVSSYPS